MVKSKQEKEPSYQKVWMSSCIGNKLKKFGILHLLSLNLKKIQSQICI